MVGRDLPGGNQGFQCGETPVSLDDVVEALVPGDDDEGLQQPEGLDGGCEGVEARVGDRLVPAASVAPAPVWVPMTKEQVRLILEDLIDD